MSFGFAPAEGTGGNTMRLLLRCRNGTSRRVARPEAKFVGLHNCGVEPGPADWPSPKLFSQPSAELRARTTPGEIQRPQSADRPEFARGGRGGPRSSSTRCSQNRFTPQRSAVSSVSLGSSMCGLSWSLHLFALSRSRFFHQPTWKQIRCGVRRAHPRPQSAARSNPLRPRHRPS